MISLATQSFGKESEYKRAILTILSFYAHLPNDSATSQVVLFTDYPTYFEFYLQGVPVKYVTLTTEKIKVMRGTIDFLHRMKIALIEEAFHLVQSNLIYVDSDTFFIADPTPLLEKLSPVNSFMHLKEYEFEKLWNQPLPFGQASRAFIQLIESKQFLLAGGSKISVTPKHYSWNAGVMFFHATHARFIPDVYSLTDQFYLSTQSHASEQYAFSVVLQENTKLEPCNSVIYHYWYRVKKQIIDLFLAEQINISLGEKALGQKLEQVRAWCTMLPGYFEENILMVKDNAIQSFNERKYWQGYKYALKVFSKKPFDFEFFKDVFYHTKKWLKH
ncbi:hypothetical protein AHMF7605_00255 [Adhaeribacter arboris]|uniref:Nucleotide-diphospho-sugar transferase domain-containing protein n=1 Tax=Adhaeribacter arboris TaxID=2072846 RepID=A0A2T2Y958_9BACT|nr:hypothetical protein [Adhaeribacter arboris]PSR52059.1 hypothetical protein AHMF7605_00255 [Adhaeribacter arboris]